MKKKKVISVLLSAVMLTGILIGCSSSQTDSPPPASKATEAKAEEKEDATDKTSSVSDETEALSTEDNGDDTEGWSGTVTINTGAGPGAAEAWQAVADGYMAINPGVDIVIDLKPSDGYAEWIKSMFGSADPETDIVSINMAGPAAVGKDINLMEYVDTISPYSDGPWKEQFNFELQNTVDSARGTWNNLSLESVQVRWFYNKNIFEEVGVEPPKTWEEFIDVCEKIEDAGYQALSVPGDFNSFWSGQMGWLVQFYADQVTRSQINFVRAQDGDYCFDPDIDGIWSYDAKDPHNDDDALVHKNPVRFAAALRKGFDGPGEEAIRADSPGYKTFMTHLSEVFPRFAGNEAFYGTKDAIPMFYQGKAAMYLDGGWRFVSFMNDMEKLSKGEDVTTGSGEDEVIIEGIEPFELGSFNNPTMDGEGVEADVRTIEVAVGFLGAVKKDKEHDDLVVDFLMYLSSKEGYGKYLTAGLDAGASASGPPLVYGVELPEKYAKLFDGLEFIGNCQKGFGQAMSRGAPGDVQESLRDWYQYTQDFFNGTIDVDAWGEKHQANVEKYFLDSLTAMKIQESDLDNPQNEPTGE